MNSDIIAISETRITKNRDKISNINLNNYAFEFTPTESSAGGTSIYVANHLAFMANFEQSGSRIPDAWSVRLTFALTATFCSNI